MILNKDSNAQLPEFSFGKKLASVSASLMLLQMTYSPIVFAQSSSSSASSNTTGLPGTANPDAWPWMQVNPDGVKQKDGTGESLAPVSASAASSQSSSAQPSTPANSSTAATSPGAFPDALTGSSAPAEKAEPKPASSKLEPEHPKAAEVKHEELRREPTASLKAEQATTVQPKSRMIFGRIEQLTASAGAKFPVLKAQTAKLDLSGQQVLKAGATDNMFSGQIVRSFPNDMNGNWGGVLQLSAINLDPLYYQVDAAEAKQTADLMRPGLQGKVNMTFQNTGGGVTLEPAKIFFSAPMTQSRMAGQISAMGSGGMTIPGMGNIANNPGMNQMMQQMMMSMPYIWYMSLGSVQGTGISGNTVQNTLVKNDVRQLSPTVIEQQIISREYDSNPKTGKSRSSYSESVVRFTKYNSSQQYVQAVAVDYSEDKRFLRKMVFAGYVTKGVTEQMPNPMGGLSGLGGLGGLGGAGGSGAGGSGGLPGLGDLQKLFPGGLPGGSNGMPGGMEGNPFKGLFGQ